MTTVTLRIIYTDAQVAKGDAERLYGMAVDDWDDSPDVVVLGCHVSPSTEDEISIRQDRIVDDDDLADTGA